jgi:serine/threonine-protein kinase 24/25/MST4
VCFLASIVLHLKYHKQRPTANELLQHRFIRSARKTSYLTELIERYQDYRARSPAKGQQMFQPSVRNSMSWENNSTMRSDWNFDTIKSNAAMGTFRSMTKDLTSTGEELDEDDSPEGQESIDTTAATQGSDSSPALGGLGMNLQAAHSTVIIRSPHPLASEDPPALVTSEDSSSGDNSSSSPETPSPNHFSSPPLGAPPAYTGSVRSNRRSSYAERHAINGPGTMLREADIGNGIDTIRPMKKIDAAGSLRLSAEYVGSARKDGSGSLPPSPSKSSITHKRAASEVAKAGKSLVDEVVVPILQKVCS